MFVFFPGVIGISLDAIRLRQAASRFIPLSSYLQPVCLWVHSSAIRKRGLWGGKDTDLVIKNKCEPQGNPTPTCIHGGHPGPGQDPLTLEVACQVLPPCPMMCQILLLSLSNVLTQCFPTPLHFQLLQSLVGRADPKILLPGAGKEEGIKVEEEVWWREWWARVSMRKSEGEQ